MIVNSQNLKNTTTIDIESWITTANDAVNSINKKIKILINRYKKSNGYKDFYIFSTPMRKTSQSGKIFYKANITLYKDKNFDSENFQREFNKDLVFVLKPFEIGLN